ncbi:PilW family protein [Noviherbaspirillum sp.]|uniref:PilW family protein n=1 Tax=Noviherbaspirillum sp. TaxID=1926288 RepID=UPI002FE1932E
MTIRRCNRMCYQGGLTLIELMISITLGLLVMLAATALLLSSKSAYTAQDDGTRLQDTGRYASEVISRSVRQAAYENWDRQDAPIVSAAGISANIAGLDARSLSATTNGITSPVASSVNGSDVLAVRFFGSGAGEHGDGSMINCAGFGVAAATSQDSADEERGTSIFYVARDAGGEPQLYCKFHGKKGWVAQALARGVESFQVLYGIDSDGDSLPNQYLNAASLQALDAALVLTGATAQEQAVDRNRKTWWKKVVVIRTALLLRGTEKSRTDALTSQYDLFGRDYSDLNASADVGTRILEAQLPESTRNRIRKISATTIQLRNQSPGSAI